MDLLLGVQLLGSIAVVCNAHVVTVGIQVDIMKGAGGGSLDHKQASSRTQRLGTIVIVIVALFDQSDRMGAAEQEAAGISLQGGGWVMRRVNLKPL